MNRFKSNQQRAKIAEYAFIAFILISLLSIVSYLFQYRLLLDAENEIIISIKQWEYNDLRISIIYYVFLAVVLFCYATFILWFRRAYYNQEQKFDRMEFSNGWAAGSWFVPILNFFRPYQMMQEIYINAENYLVNNDLGLKNKFRYQLMGWWWAFWVILSILSRVFSQLYSLRTSSTIPEFKEATLVTIGFQLAFILLAFVAIQVIRNYNKMELKLIAHDSDGNGIFSTENSDLLDS